MKKTFIFLLLSLFLSLNPAEAILLSSQTGEILSPGEKHLGMGFGGGYGERMGLKTYVWYLKLFLRKGKSEKSDWGLSVYPLTFALSGDYKYRIIKNIFINGEVGFFTNVYGSFAPFFSLTGIVNKKVGMIDFFAGPKFIYPAEYWGIFGGIRINRSVILEASFLKIFSQKRSYLVNFGISSHIK